MVFLHESYKVGLTFAWYCRYYDESYCSESAINIMKFSNKLKLNLILAGLAIAILLGSMTPSTRAANPDGFTIPMHNRGASTFYVKAKLGSLQDTELMVDTGSGYMTINEESLARLKQQGEATFVKKIGGILANGSKLVVPVWRIEHLSLNGGCELHGVEAAVFPGKTRQILGLSALKKAGRMTLSFDPPQLTLRHCAEAAKGAF